MYPHFTVRLPPFALFALSDAFRRSETWTTRLTSSHARSVTFQHIPWDLADVYLQGDHIVKLADKTKCVKRSLW